MFTKFNSFKIDVKSKNILFVKDSAPWLINSFVEKFKKVLFITSSNLEISDLSNKLSFLNDNLKILTFPENDGSFSPNLNSTNNTSRLRITTLSNLINESNKNTLVLTTYKALVLKNIPKDELFNNFLLLKKDESEIGEIKSFFNQNSYEKVETVRECGEFSIRGSIIDFFSPNSIYPIRLDFFLNKIETLKYFNPITQLSFKNIDQFEIIPSSEICLNKDTIKNFRTNYRMMSKSYENKNFYNAISNGIKPNNADQYFPLFFNKLDSIFEYTNNFKIIIDSNYKNKIIELSNSLKQDYKNYNPFSENELKKILIESEESINLIEKNDPIKVSNLINIDINKEYLKVSAPIENLNNLKNLQIFEFLKTFIKKKIIDYDFVFTSSNELILEKIKKNLNNFSNFFQNSNDQRTPDDSKINFYLFSLKQSFKSVVNRSKGLIVFSDEDLFGKKIYKKTYNKVDASNYINEISNLKENELVVHVEHGIGQYRGLKNVPLQNIIHECVEIEYYNKDKLLIPVENLELITRYGSKDSLVSLDKLGAYNWQERKASIKKRIKEIAGDLVKIAAERKIKKGKVIIADSELYRMFSENFNYAETSDQLKAINDIENDFSSGVPMDRLICGDVGFGKTEIAMRAAFIAVSAGFQVAFMCPTTLLANQHYNNFIERFKGFDFTIEKITRFEVSSKKKKIFDSLKLNKLKILIGTHSILNDSIEFSNLGLLVVDEEQSFGVEQKEKLKKMKSNIHVLTLTATPIPRTLQSTILGIKELSLIKTPPLDRVAIKTYLTPFNKQIIKNAIFKEIDRGGQVFYVSPKIKDLGIIKNRLSNFFPHLKTEIVHGKLKGNILNNIYEAFFEKKINILISTSIIESGLDISNANTIIINKPNFFGLSQLYQLRGRVGRSNVQAFAYFIIPDNEIMSVNATKRLEVISKLDKLGAGFSLASHDMDIRGTGNLIGSEQSGHVKEIGIELYQKLVKNAVDEILNNKDVIDEDWSPQINLGFPVFIPKDYIKDLQIRLSFYRRISLINSIDKINDILIELEDRYGKIPCELLNLTKIIELKYLCKKVNISKIDLGLKGFTISFKDNRFRNINNLINLVKRNPKKLKIRPDNKLIYFTKKENISKTVNEIKNFLNIIKKIND